MVVKHNPYTTTTTAPSSPDDQSHHCISTKCGTVQNKVDDPTTTIVEANNSVIDTASPSSSPRHDQEYPYGRETGSTMSTPRNTCDDIDKSEKTNNNKINTKSLNSDGDGGSIKYSPTQRLLQTSRIESKIFQQGNSDLAEHHRRSNNHNHVSNASQPQSQTARSSICGIQFNLDKVKQDAKKAVGTILTPPSIPNTHYFIDRVVQTAIYGAVFMAYEYILEGNHSSRKVALKVMYRGLDRREKGTLQEDPRAEIRYRKFMEGHKNVLVYDYYWEDNFSVFLVMPFAEFEDLFEVLKKQKTPFSEEQARWLFHQILAGAQYLHDRGIAFRDYSLENILMFYDENTKQIVPKITDPGQATQLVYDKNGDVEEVIAEKTFGKTFRPPEVYKKGLYDPTKVDVFCLGWMLFFSVTKHQAFQRATSNDACWKLIRQKRYNKLLLQHGSLLESPLSTTLQTLLWSMLEPNPKKRLSLHECRLHSWFKGPVIPIDPKAVFKLFGLSETRLTFQTNKNKSHYDDIKINNNKTNVSSLNNTLDPKTSTVKSTIGVVSSTPNKAKTLFTPTHQQHHPPFSLTPLNSFTRQPSNTPTLTRKTISACTDDKRQHSFVQYKQQIQPISSLAKEEHSSSMNRNERPNEFQSGGGKIGYGSFKNDNKIHLRISNYHKSDDVVYSKDGIKKEPKLINISSVASKAISQIDEILDNKKTTEKRINQEQQTTKQNLLFEKKKSVVPLASNSTQSIKLENNRQPNIISEQKMCKPIEKLIQDNNKNLKPNTIGKDTFTSSSQTLKTPANNQSKTIKYDPVAQEQFEQFLSCRLYSSPQSAGYSSSLNSQPNERISKDVSKPTPIKDCTSKFPLPTRLAKRTITHREDSSNRERLKALSDLATLPCKQTETQNNHPLANSVERLTSSGISNNNNSSKDSNMINLKIRESHATNKTPDLLESKDDSSNNKIDNNIRTALSKQNSSDSALQKASKHVHYAEKVDEIFISVPKITLQSQRHPSRSAKSHKLISNAFDNNIITTCRYPIVQDKTTNKKKQESQGPGSVARLELKRETIGHGLTQCSIGTLKHKTNQQVHRKIPSHSLSSSSASSSCSSFSVSSSFSFSSSSSKLSIPSHLKKPKGSASANKMTTQPKHGSNTIKVLPPRSTPTEKPLFTEPSRQTISNPTSSAISLRSRPPNISTQHCTPHTNYSYQRNTMTVRPLASSSRAYQDNNASSYSRKALFTARRSDDYKYFRETFDCNNISPTKPVVTKLSALLDGPIEAYSLSAKTSSRKK